jgi:1-acyl-sn-glycerol-3-phosphate acyltransferase
MISRLLAKLIFSPFGKLRVLHRENSALTGPYILAANHISHFDPPLLSVAARRKIDWMAMSDLFRSRIFLIWARSIGTFSTDREKPDRASVKMALARLKQGRVVGIFPEAGLRDGERSVLNGAPVDPGAAALAQMERVPVVPCVILGTDRLYNPRNWIPFRRVTVWIGFGRPLAAPAGMGKNEARVHLDRELCAALRNLCAEMRTHYSLGGDDMPQPPQRRRQPR